MTLPTPVFFISAKYSEVDLSISSVGTGAGQAALWGDVDCEKKPVEGVCPLDDLNLPDMTAFGIGGNPLDEEDIEEHAAIDLQHIPAFASPVLIVYSKDGTGELGRDTSQQLNMSYATIAGIFSGKIEYWNDTQIQAENPELELPNELITVLVRSDKSGMTQSLTEFIYHPNLTLGPRTPWEINQIGPCPTSRISASPKASMTIFTPTGKVMVRRALELAC